MCKVKQNYIEHEPLLSKKYTTISKKIYHTTYISQILIEISFRREEGYCRICWYAASISDVDLGGKATKGVIKVSHGTSTSLCKTEQEKIVNKKTKILYQLINTTFKCPGFQTFPFFVVLGYYFVKKIFLFSFTRTV